MDEIPTPLTTEPIICRVTPWYFKRMSMMAGMIALFGLYFLYDGKFGYPKANLIADKKTWFDEVVLKSFDEAKAAGKLEAWTESAKAQGWPLGREKEPPRWISYAAKNGWPEKPPHHSPEKIEEQFYWGGGTLLVGFIVAGVMLMNKNKILRAEADHLIMPEGQKVFFADAFRVDKRKWEVKALAYVWHKPVDGKTSRVVIDDLKYGGAGLVLDRLLANFQGELIEKLADPAESPEEASAESTQV
jgi:hypothetical protein